MTVDAELFGDPLPTYFTRFIGRERECAELADLLRSPGVVTVCGVGGSGKTRLAVQVARQLRADADLHVCWVPLATTLDSAGVVPAVAHGLTPMIASECIVARSPDVANGQLQPVRFRRAAREWEALEAKRRSEDVGMSLAVPVFGQDASLTVRLAAPELGRRLRRSSVRSLCHGATAEGLRPSATRSVCRKSGSLLAS
jgi:hypothetical protein